MVSISHIGGGGQTVAAFLHTCSLLLRACHMPAARLPHCNFALRVSVNSMSDNKKL